MKAKKIKLQIELWESRQGTEVDFHSNIDVELEPGRTMVLMAIAALAEKLLGKEMLSENAEFPWLQGHS